MTFLVGLTEIAEARGFSKQRALQLSKDPDFPAPIAVLAMGSVWFADDVESFFRRRYGPSTLEQR